MVQSRHGCFVHTLDHFVLTVSNIPVTVQFYTTVLGMRALQFETSDGEVRWALAYGASKINLHQSGHEFEPKAAHSKPGSADLCFLTDTSIETWIEHLNTEGIVVEHGPIARSGAMGPLISIYVRDPDLNLIEVSVQN